MAKRRPKVYLDEDTRAYVVAALKAVEPEAVNRFDLVENYRPSGAPNDLSRIRAELQDANPKGGPWTDYAVFNYLIRKAVADINLVNPDAIETDGADYQLSKGTNAYALTYEDAVILPEPAPPLPDLFDPETGAWRENSRATDASDLGRLRESMAAFGWLPELPAIADENGVVIVGHRRLAVAAELGIEPVITRKYFGGGEGGKARRMRLAIASNDGGKPLSPADRKQQARDLYLTDKSWTMTELGKLFNVSAMTISRDVRDLTPVKFGEGRKRGRPRKVEPEPVEETAPEPETEGEPDEPEPAEPADEGRQLDLDAPASIPTPAQWTAARALDLDATEPSSVGGKVVEDVVRMASVVATAASWLVEKEVPLDDSMRLRLRSAHTSLSAALASVLTLATEPPSRPSGGDA